MICVSEVGGVVIRCLVLPECEGGPTLIQFSAPYLVLVLLYRASEVEWRFNVGKN